MFFLLERMDKLDANMLAVIGLTKKGDFPGYMATCLKWRVVIDSLSETWEDEFWEQGFGREVGASVLIIVVGKTCS
jgi:hypothetical protein